jgi:hypothetical protein
MAAIVSLKSLATFLRSKGFARGGMMEKKGANLLGCAWSSRLIGTLSALDQNHYEADSQ